MADLAFSRTLETWGPPPLLAHPYPVCSYLFPALFRPGSKAEAAIVAWFDLLLRPDPHVRQLHRHI